MRDAHVFQTLYAAERSVQQPELVPIWLLTCLVFCLDPDQHSLEYLTLCLVHRDGTHRCERNLGSHCVVSWLLALAVVKVHLCLTCNERD